MRYYHVTISAYGFWLPNDPRGSGSSTVRTQHLYEVGGPATKVDTTHSVANRKHDREIRLATKAVLKRPVVQFNGLQARAIARGVASVLPKVDVILFALAIMPDHLHAVAGSASFYGKKIETFLKSAGTRGLNEEGLHPFKDHPKPNGVVPSPWAEGGWKVRLETEEDILRTTRYVEQNPIKARMKAQLWSCVTQFDPS